MPLEPIASSGSGLEPQFLTNPPAAGQEDDVMRRLTTGLQSAVV